MLLKKLKPCKGPNFAKQPSLCNVLRLDVNPEIPNPSGGTMQNNSVITADLTNRTFGA